jgi:hypothetical protein
VKHLGSKKILFSPDNHGSDIDFNLPSPSAKNMPEWYKGIPQFIEGTPVKATILTDSSAVNSTIKRCTPFLDGMTAGYMFTTSVDIEVQYQEGNSPFLRWRNHADYVTTHSANQHPGLPVPKGYHSQVYKWKNDWQIKTPKGYSLWCTHPSNRFDLPFYTLTGFVDTDTWNTTVQFPFFIQEGFYGIIPEGTPVAQLIPVKREDWILEEQPYDERRSRLLNHTFLKKIERSYKSTAWSKKTYQ